MSGLVVLGIRLALLVALYAFMSLAFYALWIGLRRQAAGTVSLRVPELELTIRTAGEETLRRFTQRHVTIGRDASCDVRLADRMASAFHARLSYHHSQWWLEDLASHNGTRLNGQRVSTATVITADDEIVCGEASISVGLPVESPVVGARKEKA